MATKAIFFDIDGTLVDSNEGHVLAWQQAFADAGAHFDLQTLHDQIGKGTDMLVPTLLPGIGKAEEKRLGEAQGTIFKETYLAQIKAFPRARDLLEHVHRCGQQVVLASSASQAELDHYIDLLAVKDILAATTTSEDVAKTKPAPDIFTTALGKLHGVAAAEVVVVGDTPYDVEAAGKAGMVAVAVRSGKFEDAALRKAGALAIYQGVAALLEDYAHSPLGQS